MFRSLCNRKSAELPLTAARPAAYNGTESMFAVPFPAARRAARTGGRGQRNMKKTCFHRQRNRACYPIHRPGRRLRPSCRSARPAGRRPAPPPLSCAARPARPRRFREAQPASIIEFTAVYTRSRMEDVAGIGGNDTLAAANAARRAGTARADALLLATPLYDKASSEGIVRHFAYVAEHSALAAHRLQRSRPDRRILYTGALRASGGDTAHQRRKGSLR